MLPFTPRDKIYLMNKQSRRLTLLLILLFGYALRLLRLGAQSLWYDETVSAVLAQKSIPKLIAHTARDIHPPGYYLLLRGWTRLAGDSEFALAYFSLLFGVLLIAAVYALGRLLNSKFKIQNSKLGDSAALWAAGLVALSPYNVWYSQEVRMYTLGAFLGVMVVYYGMQAVSHQPLAVTRHSSLVIRHWTLYALFAAAGLYTLYYFAFLLIAFNLFLLAYILKSLLVIRHSSFVIRHSSLAAWLLANLAVLVLYLPWLPIAWKQVANPPVPPWRSDVPLTQVALEAWSALTLGESVEPGQVWPVLLISLAIFAIGLYAVKSTWKRILLLTLTFGPLAIILLLPLATGSPLYHARYVFTCSPAFYLILGAGLAGKRACPEPAEGMKDEGRRRKENLPFAIRHSPFAIRYSLFALLATAALLLGSGFSIYQMHANPKYASDDFRGAVAFLQEKWRPGDVILVNAGYTYTALQYYFTDPIDNFQRLGDFDPQTSQRNPYHPLILQSGAVDGSLSLGGGDPQSDFYAISRKDTENALLQITQSTPRIWMLRAYDTVSDPNGVIRQWLREGTLPFEDQGFTGESNIRVQGFLSKQQPSPPKEADFNFEDRLQLRGFTPVGGQYQGGQTIHTALWMEARRSLAAEAPFALSLKLWDSAGNQIAQSDEWPVGSLYFTPVWTSSAVIRHPMRMVLAPNIKPGHYWLDVEIYRSDDGIPLKIMGTEKHGVTLGEVEVVK